MALTLTLTPASNAITAKVSGLDPAYEKDRTLRWYLDGVPRHTDTVKPQTDSVTHVFARVYFASRHQVRCEIHDPDGALLATLTGETDTLYANVPLWGWQTSNGDATAEETAAAYTTAANQGQVVDFVHTVWNDLVELIAQGRAAIGKPWLTSGNALVGGRYGSLMAGKFNAVVEAIGYPYWSWWLDKTSRGYLGRLNVRGVSAVGPVLADTVYGYYLLELAKRLNVVLTIYNGTASTKEMFYIAALAELTHAAGAVTRPIKAAAHHSRLANLTHTAMADTAAAVWLSWREAMTLSHTAPAVTRETLPLTADRGLSLSHAAELIATQWALLHAGEHLSLTQRMALGNAPSLRLPGGAVTVRAVALGTLLSQAAASLGGVTGAEATALGELSAILVAQLASAVRAAASAEGTAKTCPGRALTAPNVPVHATVAGTAKAVRPKYTGGSVELVVSPIGGATTSRPTYVTGSVSAVETGSGTAALRPPHRITGKSGNVLDLSGTLALQQTVRLGASVNISATTLGAVDFEGGGSTWKYPDQNGDELTVYQVHLVWQERDWAQIDWMWTTELAAHGNLNLTADKANAFAKSRWTYPVQDETLLTVYQSLAVVQTYNRIEVS